MKTWVVSGFLFLLLYAPNADATTWMSCTGNGENQTVEVSFPVARVSHGWTYLDRDFSIRFSEEEEVIVGKKHVKFYRISEEVVVVHARDFDGPGSYLNVFYTWDEIGDSPSLIEYVSKNRSVHIAKDVFCSY